MLRLSIREELEKDEVFQHALEKESTTRKEKMQEVYHIDGVVFFVIAFLNYTI